jgi:hypothetical protein
MTAVPRLWPDETVIVIASGPSLTQTDVDACRGRRVIAVKDAIRLAPWADALYFAGVGVGTWWTTYRDLIRSFDGLKFTLEPKAEALAPVLRNTGMLGLETDPTGLRHGRNSGYQAVNVAVHFGARRIVLLGFDMQRDDKQRSHFFGEHAYQTVPSHYDMFTRCFDSMIEPLQALGVEVLNATRATALRCFPCVDLTEALA